MVVDLLVVNLYRKLKTHVRVLQVFKDKLRYKHFKAK